VPLKPSKPRQITISRHFCGLRSVDRAYDSFIARMELVNHRTQNRCRILAALVCLLAVAFLYAPFAAAAWSSHAMACCTDGFCNIPKHHHKKAPANSTASEDCDHQMGGMMDCSMSCCQDPVRPAVTSMAFVLPPATCAASAMSITGAVERVHSIEIPRTIAPLSPPPRTDNTAR
jgi:hypothetical protein